MLNNKDNRWNVAGDTRIGQTEKIQWLRRRIEVSLTAVRAITESQWEGKGQRKEMLWTNSPSHLNESKTKLDWNSLMATDQTNPSHPFTVPLHHHIASHRYFSWYCSSICSPIISIFFSFSSWVLLLPVVPVVNEVHMARVSMDMVTIVRNLSGGFLERYLRRDLVVAKINGRRHGKPRSRGDRQLWGGSRWRGRRDFFDGFGRRKKGSDL